MKGLDLYLATGFAFELLARSTYHRQFSIGPYFTTEILPALRCGQSRFYVNDNGVPTGMVTWARLSDAVEADVLRTGRALGSDEWASGPNLFFNDFIAPYGTKNEIIRDLRNVFPGETGSSVRRSEGAAVRKTNRWFNLRRSTPN